MCGYLVIQSIVLTHESIAPHHNQHRSLQLKSSPNSINICRPPFSVTTHFMNLSSIHLSESLITRIKVSPYVYNRIWRRYTTSTAIIPIDPSTSGRMEPPPAYRRQPVRIGCVQFDPKVGIFMKRCHQWYAWPLRPSTSRCRFIRLISFDLMMALMPCSGKTSKRM